MTDEKKSMPVYTPLAAELLQRILGNPFLNGLNNFSFVGIEDDFQVYVMFWDSYRVAKYTPSYIASKVAAYIGCYKHRNSLKGNDFTICFPAIAYNTYEGECTLPCLDINVKYLRALCMALQGKTKEEIAAKHGEEVYDSVVGHPLNPLLEMKHKMLKKDLEKMRAEFENSKSSILETYNVRITELSRKKDDEVKALKDECFTKMNTMTKDFYEEVKREYAK